MPEQQKLTSRAAIRKVVEEVLDDYEIDLPKGVEDCPNRCSTLERMLSALKKRIDDIEHVLYPDANPLGAKRWQCQYCKRYFPQGKISQHREKCERKPVPMPLSEVEAWRKQQRRLHEIGRPVGSGVPAPKAVKNLSSSAPKGRLPGSFQANA